MKKIFMLLIAVVSGIAAFSQSYDVVTFETAVTVPSAKAYNNTSGFSLNGVSWILPGVYLGVPDAADFKIDNHSARIRRLNDATGANGYLEMKEDYPFGFEYFGFMAAMYGNDAGGRLAVAYSQDNGASWVGADTFTIAPNNTPTRYQIHEHIFGNVRFRISKVDNSDARINIDSVYCIPMNMPPADLSISHFTPRGRTHPSIDKLVLQFDQHIIAGDSGTITLVDATSNTATSYNLQHPDLEIRGWGDSLLIHNVTLTPLHSYYVLFDSTLIRSMFFNDMSDGIYDSTRWTFYVTLPVLTNVDERFDYCDQWDLMGIFQQYSVKDGSRRWHCEEESGNKFISMTGNSDNNTAVANEDWLVSYLKFDFMGKAPYILFSERKTGTGYNVVRKLMYTNHFSVNITTSRWTELWTIRDVFTDNGWKETGLHLNNTAIRNEPVYLALVYMNERDASEASAWKWSVDNFRIIVDTTTGMEHIDNMIPSFYVAYPAAADKIDIVLYSNDAIDDAAFTIYDMSGKRMFSTVRPVKKGQHLYSLQGFDLPPGMFVIGIQTKYGHINKKVIIHP